MDDLDLSSLRTSELRDLIARISREIASRRLRRRFGGGLCERSAALYRNPENPAQTWSGRGERPAWIVRALSQGTSLESLRD